MIYEDEDPQRVAFKRFRQQKARIAAATKRGGGGGVPPPPTVNYLLTEGGQILTTEGGTEILVETGS